MKFKQTLITYSISAALLALTGNAAASGFALIEQSGSGLGNAYAGGAAGAEDASTIFFNPAGMSRLNGKQIVVAGNFIKPSAKFSDTGSVNATLRPLGTLSGDAGSLALVPNGYFSMEVNPGLHAGIGINAPFGLKTEYSAGWIGRFQALKSSIQTVNLNPSLAYRMNDQVSIGVGLNYQHIKAELTNAQSFGTSEGMANMTGSDSAWGFNLGAIYESNSGNRFGIAYRSSINYQLAGTTVVTTAAGTVALNAPITADFKTPDSLSMSYFNSISDQWDVMADITRTGWSSFQELRVVNSLTASPLSVTPEKWSDTWRVAIGANHHYSAQWMARAGVAFDQAPVSDAYRTARIPDNDRTWLSVGGQYKPNKESALDFGYAHLFVKDSTISNNNGSAGTPSTATVGNLVGTYKNSVDILSMQYTHSF